MADTTNETVFKIKPHVVSQLIAPTPRTWKETRLSLDENMERRFPSLSAPSFIKKERCKLANKIRIKVENVLVAIKNHFEKRGEN